ncbi:MAG: sugar ABC transporter substrate-binding protein [Alicyclobacillus sp.]|nr:sugar ABC transporter substrate-binding protein [Alicyclobacillus sp.]
MKKRVHYGCLSLLAVGSLAILSIAGCGNGSNFNSKQENNSLGSARTVGTKVLHMLYTTDEADAAAIEAVIPEYEKMTGIHIDLTTEPYNNLQQKVFQELANKSSYYDVMVIDTPWMPALTSKLYPITNYLMNPQTAKEIDVQDFIPKVFYDTTVYNPKKPWLFPSNTTTINVARIKKQGFEIYGLPIQANVLTLSYRKDLFDNPSNQKLFKKKYGYNLQPPTTWKQFLDVAKFFTDPNKNLYGTTLMPGVGDWATDDFKTFLASWGGNGRLIDNNLEPVFDTPQAVQALTFYNDLINKFKVVPPGTTTFGWDEAATAFDSGLTAMSMNYHTVALASNVKGGEIDYAMVPGNVIHGKLVRGPHFGTWELSINKYSKNRDAAFNFISWLTSAKVQEQMLKEQLHPTRISVYKYAESDKELTSKFGHFYSVLGKSLAIGEGRPRITNYSEVDNAIATAVNNIVTQNGNIQSNLDTAKQQVLKLLKQAGYRPGHQ